MGDESPKVQQKILSVGTAGISSQYVLVLSKKTERTGGFVINSINFKIIFKKPEKSLNEKIQRKSNKILKNEREKYAKRIRSIYARKYILEKSTCLRKIQENPKNVMEASQEKRGFKSGCLAYHLR